MIQHLQSGKNLSTQVEHYRSASERSRGLLKFEKQPESFSAIFYLPMRGFFPAVHTFGMKFSIDLVFCNNQKKIISIFRDVAPGRFIVPWRHFFGGSIYLIEFAGCDIGSLSLGDQLEW